MSEEKYKVPIKNLFCILCYVHDIPDLVKALSKEDKDLPRIHLLADLYLKELEILMKRGFIRDYRSQIEETNQLSGRIIFEQSLNQIIQRKPILVCEKDQYDDDILLNQILKATLYTLSHVETLSNEHKAKIYLYMNKLGFISNVILVRKHFFQVRLTRNNQHYGQLLQLSRLIYELKNLSDEEENLNLLNILNDDRKMQVIFEKFIRNFYHYEQRQFISKSEKLKWKMTGENTAILPEMNTDISLIDKKRRIKIIIDAKYYADIFLKSFNTDKIRSGHLYQLYTYLNHGSEMFISRGILVYPTNGINVDETYTIPIESRGEVQQTTIRIYTLDLGQEWSNIYTQMFDLIR